MTEKKATAQLRPTLNVPIRGIGPISEPNGNDVLCGRGGRVNSHEGNVRFRDIIRGNQKEYLAPTTKKLEKVHIAKRIVDEIRNMNPPGRFLKQDTTDGYWYDIGDAKAIKKVGQALREDAPGIRNEMEADINSEDDKTPPKKKAAPNAVPSSAAAADVNVTYAAPSPGYDDHAAPPPAGYDDHAAPAPTGYDDRGQSDGYAHHQSHSNNSWMPHHHMHRQHSAPSTGFGYEYANSMYNIPSRLYNGVRSTGNKFSKMSQTATEAMRQQHYPPHPGAPSPSGGGGGVPPNQVAFGRVFTPTVMSSGSTMSTISGLSSGISGAENAVRGSGSQQQRGSSNEFNSLRMSQLSDMTTNMMSLSSSLGLTRSNSLPELGLSKDFTSISDSSFGALMEEVEVAPGEWAPADAVMQQQGGEFRDSGGTSSSSGYRPPPIPGAPTPSRTRTTSAVSAMSWASAGSQRSTVSSSVRSAGSETSWLNPVRSRLTGSIHSDHSFSSSTRSVFSDMSADVHALDLAQPPI